MNKLEEKAEEAKETKKEMEEWLYPTSEMYKKLYEENSVLAQIFIEKNSADKFSEEDILLLLKKELEGMRGKRYEYVQDKLVELTSVYDVGSIIVTMVE